MGDLQNPHFWLPKFGAFYKAKLDIARANYVMFARITKLRLLSSQHLFTRKSLGFFDRCGIFNHRAHLRDRKRSYRRGHATRGFGVEPLTHSV